eukprot:TRINITY_DN8440_c0_g1_i1.p1 TRINITY_DN8440_c0_g1~~TRINITY_DN8440_c0_g1_i1.p1  ORF type:complete len:456 (+),score=155.77 TRINITY_DN8440_c0_g1_i1:141-1370(+)
MKAVKQSPKPQPDPNHAVSASELRARLESLQKSSTRLKVAEALDVGSSTESSPMSTKFNPRQAWNVGENGVPQFSGIARFYGDQLPYLAGGMVTFAVPLTPSKGSTSVAASASSTLHHRSSSGGPTSPLNQPGPPVMPPLIPAITAAAATASEADRHPIGQEGSLMELEEKIKSLQNAINVLHLERSSATEKANILEAHCKRITCKWEADRNRMLELEGRLALKGDEDGEPRRPGSMGNLPGRPGDSSWDAMRQAELEHLKADNARLREENAGLRKRIVGLNADVEAQSHLVRQRAKSAVPEIKVLRRRIADLEAENEELQKASRKVRPSEDVDMATLVKEHAELRAATNELLMQHDKVCSEYLALRDQLGTTALTPEEGEFSPDPVDQAPIRLVAVGCDEYVAEADYC